MIIKSYNLQKTEFVSVYKVKKKRRRKKKRKKKKKKERGMCIDSIRVESNEG